MKIRELGDNAFVTLESDQDIPAIRKFYDQEMEKLKFVLKEGVTNDFISMVSYSKDAAILTI